MTDKTLPSGLWAPRSLDETLGIYRDWADTYDDDVTRYGYTTPTRVAEALARHLSDRDAPVLDFGCGTGLSGEALKAAGFTTIDGTDISAEMLALARAKGLYQNMRDGTPGTPPARPEDGYAAIIATGVVSLGAAPPETLHDALGALGPGGLLVFSYNEATLLDAGYHDALRDTQTSGAAVLIEANHGPHLPEKEGAQTSTVYVLRRH